MKYTTIVLNEQEILDDINSGTLSARTFFEDYEDLLDEKTVKQLISKLLKIDIEMMETAWRAARNLAYELTFDEPEYYDMYVIIKNLEEYVTDVVNERGYY